MSRFYRVLLLKQCIIVYIFYVFFFEMLCIISDVNKCFEYKLWSTYRSLYLVYIFTRHN